VNQVMGPFIERAFRAAVDRDLLTVVYGGPEVGAYLVEHASVDEVHLTGSLETHDFVVWGRAGAERDARKAMRQPRLKKTVTSELGNVSPVIVVPGPYTEAELDFQADAICTAVVNNASFNCNAARLLVQAKNWSGREALLDALARSLARVPGRPSYYPGAEQRWRRLIDRHPTVERYGGSSPGALPWALIRDVDPTAKDEMLFTAESWCPVFAETAVGSPDPQEFLEAAVMFCNRVVWGTLSATIVVHPSSMKDPKVAIAVETALRELRYGTVAINHWPALGFAFGTTPWGSHPSTTLEDIQSGSGWVHNTLMLDEAQIEKCVIRGPLVVKPRPPWFVGHRSAHRLGRRLVDMEAAPSVWRLPGLVLDALRG